MIQGKARWAKIIGKPGKGYNPGEQEWSIDVFIAADTKKQIEAEGWGSKIKNRGDGDYVQFKRKYRLKEDGTYTQPIKVYDHHGELWGKQLIGNDSVVNVKYILDEDVPDLKRKGPRVSIMAVQVWDFVPYTPKGDFPVKDAASQEENGETW